VTSNSDWVVPAGFRDRRWGVFDMGDKHMQDIPYFVAIDEEMDNGGREALLHYLLNFDLSQVDLHTVPKTAARLEQQLESMSPEEAWWLETLTRGMLPPLPGGAGLDVCSCEDMFERYVAHAKVQGVGRRAISTKLGMFLHKQLGAQLQIVRPANPNGKRIRCYQLPSLATCRELFEARLGQTIDWGVEEGKTEYWGYDQNWNSVHSGGTT
jgi:hypothetical protein